MTLKDLREHLGMGEGQLLTNGSGTYADLLDVVGDEAVLGLLETGRIVTVKVSQLVGTPGGQA